MATSRMRIAQHCAGSQSRFRQRDGARRSSKSTSSVARCRGRLRCVARRSKTWLNHRVEAQRLLVTSLPARDRFRTLRRARAAAPPLSHTKRSSDAHSSGSPPGPRHPQHLTIQSPPHPSSPTSAAPPTSSPGRRGCSDAGAGSCCPGASGTSSAHVPLHPPKHAGVAREPPKND